MSWLFRPRNPENNRSDKNMSPPYQRGNQQKNLRIEDIDTTRLTGFDPTFLERGVRALKEIEASGHSEKLLQIMLEKEKTKQREAEERFQNEEILKKERELRARAAFEEEIRKTEKAKTNNEMRLSSEKNRLKRENLETAIRQKEKAKNQWLRKEKEAFDYKQKMQREAENKRFENEKKIVKIKAQNELNIAMTKAKAKSEGRIKRERANSDVYKEEFKQKSLLRKQERVEILNRKIDFALRLTDNVFNVFSDQKKMACFVTGISGVFLSYFGCKYTFKLFSRCIEARIGKPSLVRETSRFNFNSPLKSIGTRALQFVFADSLSTLFDSKEEKLKKISEAVFKGIYFSEKQKEKLKWLTRATITTAFNKAPFQNILLHGEPGTGKTLFSKSLAVNSGLHYAVIASGDFSQLGKDAVTELHKVFDWAEKSKRGTVLFFDEADAAFRTGRESRETTMSENMRNVLSAFLYRTGAPSNKFMIVLATNAPLLIDRAVLDRMDEFVHFSLPGLKETKDILLHNINKISKLKLKTVVGPFFEKENGEELERMCGRVAGKVKGLSGRTLSKITVALQHSLYNGRISAPVDFQKAENTLVEIINGLQRNF